ncbi:ATP-binding protein [Cronbergia sp. UHCC 0137]|uniref:ATP-binding protein n=1 Tax=Cronbergia sp. UHCC 0137 TaxID=3110239 RepID=UPI002B1F281E|nr:ATP-binding protein [Cronbergia sp. UHCC 0137]MEA5617377.1 ATP-binding protein [Cronbergia sp. UHCC 0137]
MEITDFTNCDREPIHIPGSIQPHGILFVLQEPDLTILQVSNNTFNLINCHPENLVNKPLTTLLNSKQIKAIKDCSLEDFKKINPLKIVIKNKRKLEAFDGILHRYGGLLIFELESSHSKKSPSFFDFYHLVNGSITKLQKASTVIEMCAAAVKEIRRITGFDRVMIYQFDLEGSGKVIAEEKLETLTPYLNLHYPASDIPQQARQLYTLNNLRLIPDVNYQPVEITPVVNPLTNKQVDLSFSVLRSVSPIHIEYLKNMGIEASMSISLIRDQKLWGLIACHHCSPKYLNYGVRTVCEFLGKIISLELASKEENEDLDYQMKLRSIQSRFIESMSKSKNFWLNNLVESENDLLDLVNAKGAVIFLGEELNLIGNTPSEEDIQELLLWIETKLENNIFYTNELSNIYPAAEKFKAVASGLFALVISKVNRNYILWFRPEVIQVVNWGGNPNKPIEVQANGRLRLSPRKSFELWQEAVRGKSLPWKHCEINAVAELRSAIVGIVLRQADELAKINIELEHSNTELDAFAYIASHDLKEPLRGIHNYSSILLKEYNNVIDEAGVSKLQTLVRLTQRMEDLINSLLHFSRLGRVELLINRTDMNERVQNVIEMLKINLKDTEVDFRIPRPLPIINCDRSQINELFTNLITNAIKYNDNIHKLVEIGFLDSPTQDTLVFYVKDNGIGIREQHQEIIFRIFKRLNEQSRYGGGTGAGLTIVKKIIERHGGKIWVESIYGEGSTFYFTLPG